MAAAIRGVFGTFLLVLAGAGSAVVDAVSHGTIGRSAAVTAPGLTVMAVIPPMGAVSGAHPQPSVTLVFSLRRDFPWRRLPGYVLAQLSGATPACLFLWTVLGKHGELGATKPGVGTPGTRRCPGRDEANILAGARLLRRTAGPFEGQASNRAVDSRVRRLDRTLEFRARLACLLLLHRAVRARPR